MFSLKLCWVVFVLDVTLASYIKADALNKRVNSSTVFRFANIYGDHMVLQMKPFSAMVWGFGQIGEKVVVRLGSEAETTEVVKDVSIIALGDLFQLEPVMDGYVFKDIKNSEYSALSHIGRPKPFQWEGIHKCQLLAKYQHDLILSTGPEGSGIWKVTLDPQGAGGPHTVKATSVVDDVTETIALEDVLFGDVWVCSGQSNMAFTVSQAINASKAIKEASNYPEIRLFTASEIESSTPLYELKEVEQPWSVASAETVDGGDWKYFSAVCWFYGKNIYDHLKRPIGLIATDWGGTPVEAWSSPDALKLCNITGDNVDHLYLSPEEEKFFGPYEHSVLYNAMIHPFLNMTIYGAIWYQGEANSHAPYTYNCTFPAMIDDWRSKWFHGTDELTAPDFPFGFVQLSASGNDSVIAGGFPVIRWAQTANYGHVPNLREQNVFMAVAMDLGNASSPYGSIHPNDKQDVGFRLALAGRAVAYGDFDVYYSGPIVSDVIFTSVANTTTWNTTVKYQHESVGKGGIQLRSGHGFEYYCTSHEHETQSMITQAKILSRDFNSVGLTGECPAQHVLKGLRYAWYTKPCEFKKCAVYSNENELPGPPFTWNAPVN